MYFLDTLYEYRVCFYDNIIIHSFEERLISSALSILQNTFGYQEFRGNQQAIIQDIVDAKDCFVLMPTGGGKSLCYQIPALLRNGVGIVISPLISLMKDQVDALKANGVSAAYYNSSMRAAEARSVLAQLHNHELDLLYIAPERLMTEDFLQRLSSINIALFAIDEAHCVSQWGHDFRPEYTQLSALRQHFPKVPILALTATADKQTRKDILDVMALHHAAAYISSFDRPNIRYTALEKYKPFDQLTHFLKRYQQESGIIYALSRKRVEEIAEKLKNHGFKAAAYHAGLSADVRAQVQEAFLRDQIQVVVATVAFGMGIDKPNVRFVVHYDLPKNIEGYYQETGRAGRDGLASEVLLLSGAQDIITIRHFINQNNNEQQQRIESFKLNAMIQFSEAVVCRRKVLLNYFDEEHEGSCGNCDICLDPPKQYDGKLDAQKALSCVYRLQQSYGMKYVIDVLRGLKQERILKMQHDQLSTYAIGADKTVDAWNSIFRQLIHQGYLWQDINNYSILKLTNLAAPLLRGEVEVSLVQPKERLKKDKVRKTKISAEVYDEPLFEKLRQLRKSIADELNVPPYIVFGDACLISMAQIKPRIKAEMLNVSGVGQVKLERFGDAFLDLIKRHGKDE
ncbi:MAG: DNA helicase RecQ [Mariprofundaceae bacterium]